MKHIFTFLCLILIFLPSTMAQGLEFRIPHSRTEFIYNPAMAAIENKSHIGIEYRYQWLSLIDAPKMIQITIQHAQPKQNMAIGFALQRSTLGLLQTTRITPSLRIWLCNPRNPYKMRCSIGVSPALRWSRINYNHLITQVPDDPSISVLNSHRQSTLQPGIGFFYSTAALNQSDKNTIYFGISNQFATLKWGNRRPDIRHETNQLYVLTGKIWHTNSGCFDFQSSLRWDYSQFWNIDLSMKYVLPFFPFSLGGNTSFGSIAQRWGVQLGYEGNNNDKNQHYGIHVALRYFSGISSTFYSGTVPTFDISIGMPFGE